MASSKKTKTNNNHNNNVCPRPVPQTSIGGLVSMTIDSPTYQVSTSSMPSTDYTSTPPHLIPISSTAHNDEQTMIWRNLATLFERCDTNDSEIKKQNADSATVIGDLNRATNELYQDTCELKGRVDDISNEMEDRDRKMKSKLRRFISKQLQKNRETSSTAAFDGDMEVFKYVDTVREEFVETNSNTKENLMSLRSEIHDEISEIYDTYYRDYEMFVRRENELMDKLDAALKMNEQTNQRMKYLEDIIMRQIQQVRNYVDTHVAGNLREEFTKAICSEISSESNTINETVKNVQAELTDLITRSNEYHSVRYFGTVEDVKQLRETCQTLKQSIGMVDAELSDVKETVEYMKDEVGQNANTITDLEDDFLKYKENFDDEIDTVYRELDRDYYDLKDYVKTRIQRHARRDKEQTRASASASAQERTGTDSSDPISMIVSEYSDETPAPAPVPAHEPAPAPAPAHTFENEIVIIMDESCLVSDDDE